ncbi:hypothetical protein QQS21_000686 [Conoideocrella luteorostrata]|uniref:Uncharacterized protein n=1 Tax=Conoideocrella luteorostrata TaxID=1105319 RepID=A0AAJ0FYB5_9HYPO|nr:hypothetical protein QQS21_000686 [Conoideocrella luteorostrata]
MQFLELALFLATALAVPVAERSQPAPLLGPSNETAVIPDKYIVVFRDDAVTAQVEGAMTSFTTGADKVFNDGFKGFAGTLNDTALEALRKHADVEFIEKDAVVSFGCVDCEPRWTTQRGAPWGLGRISHRRKGNFNYRYDGNAGAGTCAYVIDTGIDDKHPDFEGRAKQVKSFVQGEEVDGHGHGTHCAGTVGGKVFGVAKKTSLYGVKVLANNGRGSVSGIIAGMNFVAYDHKTRKCPRGVVVNVSLGGPYSEAENRAIAKLVRSGVFVAVAAGNSAQDSSAFSPASAKGVCTVAASDVNDYFAPFSNYGKPVNVIAPGVNVLSTLPGGKTGELSGTSMAAPHVAGMAAVLAARERIRGQNICGRIRRLASKNIADRVPQYTTNALAFMGS